MGEVRQASGKGYKGAFRHLLSQHPEIKHLVMDAFERKVCRPQSRFTRQAMDEIHDSFLNALREKGLRGDDYPFCTGDWGFRALRKFLLDCHEQISSQKRYIAPARRERLRHEVESAASLPMPGTTRRTQCQSTNDVGGHHDEADGARAHPGESPGLASAKGTHHE